MFQKVLISCCLLIYSMTLLIAISPQQTWAQRPSPTPAPALNVSSLPGVPVMDVHLSDSFGKPYIPNGPVPVRIKFSGAVDDERTITLTPSEPTATVNLPKSTVGTVRFSATGLNPSGKFIPVDSAFSILPHKTATGRIKIQLIASPASVLLMGNPATLVAKVIGEDNLPAQPSEDVTISFPGAEHELNPPQIQIRRNDQYGEADLSATAPGNITLQPVVQPPTIGGQSIEALPITVGFFPPPTQLNIEPDRNTLSPPLFGRASTEIKIVLVDSNGNHVESTGVRDVILGISPTGAGQLNPSTLTIRPGEDAVTTEYFPAQGGQATIRASVSGIPANEATIFFADYPWWGGPLVWVVLLGGIIGALCKAGEQSKLQRKDVTIRVFGSKFLPWGLLGAFLAFLFGSTLLRTDVQQAFVQASSHQVVSIYWGIFGGYIGPLAIVKGLTNK